MASWDAIVVGSGLGGLTAGALAARDGKRVLVLERHTKFGGAATTFRRKGLTVEVGLHQMDGLNPGDMKVELFRRLGIDQELTFLRLPEFYAVRHPLLGGEFVMPSGIAEGREAASRRFPHQAAALGRYFDTLCAIRSHYDTLNAGIHDPWWRARNFPVFPLRFFGVVRRLGTSVGDLYDRLFGDDEAVKMTLCANLGYYSDDPHKLSLLYFAEAQCSYHRGGGHYIRGGSQKLSDSLVGIVTGAGGSARTGRTVTTVEIENGRAAGVRHVGTGGRGEEVDRAPVVFGNAAPQVLAGMLPAHLQPRFMRPFSSREFSTSLWQLFLGLNAPPSQFGARAHSTFLLPDWMRSLGDYAKNAPLLAGAPGGKVPLFVLVDYGTVDAGLTDGQIHFATMTGMDRLSNWEHLDEASYRDRKEAWTCALLAALDREFPGIAAAVVYKELATARTMRRYLNTPGGAVYGFAPTPQNLGLMYPNSRTSVPGLFLSSTFAHPGGGFTGAIFAGHNAYQAARRWL